MAVLTYDQHVLDDIISRFNLRKPNADGLRRVVFELSATDDPNEIVLNIATGVGKTWLLAALLEYAAHQGIKNLLVVLPGRTVRTKTIENFTPGAQGFIAGAEIHKAVITPQNHIQHAAAINDPNAVKLYLLNVHHLVRPDETPKRGSVEAQRTRMSRPQESIGAPVLDLLEEADDLFVVLDESHSYSTSAKRWNAAITGLQPAARIGLTATPGVDDQIIFRYTLADAISDEYVKAPVVAVRKEGYPDNEELGMLRDAKKLLDVKAQQYRTVEAEQGLTPINPIMLVTCSDTNHADQVAEMLQREEIFGDEGAVLTVHSGNLTDDIEQQLTAVQHIDSPIRAIVQVDMLNQGWNVHNVAVMVPLRMLKSGVLTEQMIGRGLRLPYGKYVGNEWVDTLDILSHTSINKALKRHGLNDDPGREMEAVQPPATTPPTAAREDSDVPTTSGHELAKPDLADLPESQVISVPVLTGDFSEHADTGQVALGLAGETGHGGVRNIDGIATAEDLQPESQVAVELRDGETFRFPKADFATEPRGLNLTSLGDTWRRDTAASFGEVFTDPISRSILVFDEKGRKVRFNSATTADVEPMPIKSSLAEDNITSAIRNLPVVKNGPEGAANIRFAEQLAKSLIKLAGGQWNMQRLANALRQTELALRSAASEAARSSTPQPRITALTLPKRETYLLPPGQRTIPHNDIDRSNFDRTVHYDGWSHRSRYSAVTFDAYSTEFRIAELLDSDSNIVWWMRLEISDGASIGYGINQRYHADFVAQDVDGTRWIIEGKSIKGRDDAVVQQKRKAAETMVRTMVTLPEWEDTSWGYLIAYEDDIMDAGNWMNLLARSGAVTMWA